MLRRFVSASFLVVTLIIASSLGPAIAQTPNAEGSKVNSNGPKSTSAAAPVRLTLPNKEGAFIVTVSVRREMTLAGEGRTGLCLPAGPVRPATSR